MNWDAGSVWGLFLFFVGFSRVGVSVKALLLFEFSLCTFRRWGERLCKWVRQVLAGFEGGLYFFSSFWFPIL